MSNSPPESLINSPISQAIIKPHFVENIRNKYNCVKCTEFLRAPVKQLSCGHRICEQCVGEVRQAGVNIKCPGSEEECEETDLTNPDHVFPDYGVVREMKGTKVYCANKDYECPEVMPWSQLKSHMEGCKYKPMECPNRDIGCLIQNNRDRMKEHEQVCEYKPQMCQYCDSRVPMREMKEGHETRCAARPKPCEFKMMGCGFTAAKKEDLLHHIEQDHYQHIQVLVNAHQKMKGEYERLKENMKQLEVKNKQLETFKENHTKKIRDTMKVTGTNTERVGTLEGHYGMLQEVNRIHESRIQTLETSGRTSSQSIPEELTRQLHTVHQTMASYNVRMAENELRFQCLETASYSGVLIWKIVDYRRRKQEAKDGKTLSLYSQPFYSSRFGYKMCCRVYLNGDGMGKGQHLSVFFVIMKGDFDDLLPWPFRQKVTLTLVDVESGRRHLSDMFRPDPTSTSFKKPTSGMNVASGCPLFAPHTSVETNTYLKNDTIYLKVTIDTADLIIP